MVAAKFGSWMSQAKDKYSSSKEDPDSKVSKVNNVGRSVKGRLIKVMLGEENKTDDHKFLVH